LVGGPVEKGKKAAARSDLKKKQKQSRRGSQPENGRPATRRGAGLKLFSLGIATTASNRMLQERKEEKKG